MLNFLKPTQLGPSVSAATGDGMPILGLEFEGADGFSVSYKGSIVAFAALRVPNNNCLGVLAGFL